MELEYDFDAIRPYTDAEMQDALKRAFSSEELRSAIALLFPGQNVDDFYKYLTSLKTIHDLQEKVVGTFFLDLLKKNGSEISISGLEGLDADCKYLFISNHRDIILDAALLDTLMIKNGFDTAENAAGDNLISKPWIMELMKLNKNFIVQRSGTKREIFEASKRLSAYIRRNIVEGRNSVWIAQREGRAKDSNDRTQESVLKMFSMSGGKDLKQSFLELNITPVSISYEYDSCDFLKAKEFQQKRDDADFVKSANDDVISMKTGIMGYKGLIHFEVNKPINDILEREILDTDDRATILQKMAAIIDREIHANYRIYPGNYIALDELNGKSEYVGCKYTEKEKAAFDEYLAGQLAKIDLPNKDEAFLRERMLTMYSNLLKNHLEAIR
ncbi:MAG TPA: 1-acyl-sn-glycerol-3-phosphate acyltransferase [Paludibacteraceae bacterium]|nr:1-acyl-sn-glycerol-3-phosphate acyltransferase [Paludibacteraceae bacterium]